VAVTAPPIDNEANDALLGLLAKRCRVPQQTLSIVAGAKSRNKIVHVAGEPSVLAAQLATLLAPP
jgi:uncharacterized protein